MAMTARRIAGKVGGGPASILFFPARLGEAAALQVGVSDHRHQGMAMRTLPGAAFEVIEAELFLELLVRLIANPAARGLSFLNLASDFAAVDCPATCAEKICREGARRAKSLAICMSCRHGSPPF
jgi:hypothetical protein